MASKRDWDEVSLDLQMRKIPAKDMPRMLFECIRDLQESQKTSDGLARDIESTITWLGEQVEKRTQE